MSANKKIIRNLNLKEISAVIKPAQEPALAVIMKAAGLDPSAFLENAAKSAPEAYRASISAIAKAFEGSGSSTPIIEALAKMDACEGDEDDDFEDRADEFAKALTDAVAKSDGLAKGVADAVILALTEFQQVVKAQRAAVESKQMSDKRVADLEAANAELTAKMNKALADLDVANKALAEATAKADKLEKSFDDEKIVVKGVTFQKSTTDASTFAVMKALQEEAEVAKAESEADVVLKNMPGDRVAKGAVLRAVNAIADESTRKAARDMLEAGCKAFEGLITTKGVTQGAPAASNAEEAWEAGVKKYADDNKLTVAKATEPFSRTEEGRKLLKAYNDEAHAKSKAA